MITAEDRVKLRASVMGLVVLSLLATLVARLWYVQILTGEEYADAALANRVRLVTLEAPRGRILDRNAKVLVKNRPSLAVAIRRDDLRDRGRVLPALAKLLGVQVHAIERRLADRRASPYTPVVVADDVAPEVIFTIRERQDEFPGVEAVTLPVRTYPHGSLAAHVFGYVGETNEDELKRLRPKGYRLGDSIGRAGIERSYEADLRGIPGLEKLEVNAAGIALRSLGSREPVSGNDVRLSLDLEVQKVAEEAIVLGMQRARSQTFRETGERFRAPAGAAVVLDARSGEVVAMASVPTFDPTKFVGGVDSGYYASLNDPKSEFPLLNRVTQAAYPPGSTFKPMVASAALASGIASPSGFYPCTSVFEFGNRPFRNWQARNESISLAQSLVESCDTVYYRFAADWWRQDQAELQASRRAQELMQLWARRFGLGRATKIDLPPEDPGRIPDRAWRKEQWQRLRDGWCAQSRGNAVYADLCERGFLWRGGDSVNMSVGQGEVTATPLQMALAYGAIANGGSVLQPHLGLSVEAPDGRVLRRIGNKVSGQVGLGKAHMEYLQQALATVAVSGTARFPFLGWPLDEIPVAAKTGSSEIAGKQPFSWFAAYAPADNPKYVVVSVVEEAGFGSQVSGPIVRRVMDKLFGRPLSPIEFGVRSD